MWRQSASTKDLAPHHLVCLVVILWVVFVDLLFLFEVEVPVCIRQRWTDVEGMMD